MAAAPFDDPSQVPRAIPFKATFRKAFYPVIPAQAGAVRCTAKPCSVIQVCFAAAAYLDPTFAGMTG